LGGKSDWIGESNLRRVKLERKVRLVYQIDRKVGLGRKVGIRDWTRTHARSHSVTQSVMHPLNTRTTHSQADRKRRVDEPPSGSLYPSFPISTGRVPIETVRVPIETVRVPIETAGSL
jgi:hypothetical protein